MYFAGPKGKKGKEKQTGRKGRDKFEKRKGGNKGGRSERGASTCMYIYLGAACCQPMISERRFELYSNRCCSLRTTGGTLGLSSALRLYEYSAGQIQECSEWPNRFHTNSGAPFY